MGFGSLQHMQGSKIHITQAVPACFGPSAGFDYPLDGFRPSIPGRLCFKPAALMGFTLQRDHRIAVCAGYPANAPTFRFDQAVDPGDRSRPGGPARRGFWDLTRHTTSRAAMRANAPTGGTRPWAFSFQGSRRQPWPGLRPASSRVLCSETGRPIPSPAPQSFNQPSPRPAAATSASAERPS